MKHTFLFSALPGLLSFGCLLLDGFLVTFPASSPALPSLFRTTVEGSRKPSCCARLAARSASDELCAVKNASSLAACTHARSRLADRKLAKTAG